MGKVLDLVRPQLSTSTVEALTYLLREAQEGKITGLAFVAMRPGQALESDATGTALGFPILTRVALKELDDKLTKVAR